MYAVRRAACVLNDERRFIRRSYPNNYHRFNAQSYSFGIHVHCTWNYRIGWIFFKIGYILYIDNRSAKLQKRYNFFPTPAIVGDLFVW